MPIEILMPALSPTMKEGNLARWVKKEGDKIKAGDVIAEIETDKATMEVEAVDEGVLGKILVAEGTENVAVNSAIALLLEEGEDEAVLKNYQPKAAATTRSLASNAEQNKNLAQENTTEKTAEITSTASGTKNITAYNQAAAQSERIAASPLAKRIAAEKNLNLQKIIGSGPHGRIVKSDVLAASANGANLNFGNVVNRNPEEYRVSKNNNIRKIIAKRLLESKQNVPHFYLNAEIKIDKLLGLRADLNNALAGSTKISVNDLIIKASALALSKVPEANSSWNEDGILLYNNIDISVAVASPNGLITPIVKNADQKSVMEISAEMKNLIHKAKENKLQPEEFQGGGFSISNLGMYGIDSFSAIINPPQSCILAVGAGVEKPIVEDGEIKIGTTMNLTLSCDHRSVDGAIGAEFLKALRQIIENPLLLIIG